MPASALNNTIDAMDMSYVPPQKVTICSIYPGKILPVKRPLYGKTFVIEPGTTEKPFYLVVDDCFQSVYFGESIGERRARELAGRVAQDIVNEVCSMLSDSDAQADAFPGIFICAGDVATPEEIAIHAARQERYMRRQVSTARELHRMSLNHRISANMQIAARELDVHGEEWQEEYESSGMVPCPWCQKRIPAAAKKCAHCGEWTKPEYALEAGRQPQASDAGEVAKLKSQVESLLAERRASGLVPPLTPNKAKGQTDSI